MFVGRQLELEELKDSIKARRATLIVCRGRRRDWEKSVDDL